MLIATHRIFTGKPVSRGYIRDNVPSVNYATDYGIPY